MKKNPMQRSGAQKIEKGDRVSVAGTVDRDLFARRELMASSIVTLSNAAAGGKGSASVGGTGSEAGSTDSGTEPKGSETGSTGSNQQPKGSDPASTGNGKP